MPEIEHRAGDVFGITRDLPLNYVSRKAVDNRFIESLTRDKHLVIYGSSKQGKTCLRKHCLEESDYITVHCSNKWSLAELHSNILKRAGYEITLSSKQTVGGRKKVKATFGGKLFGVGVSTEGEKESNRSQETTTAELELEVEDVNDVIASLKKIKFDKFIVLEDFHYLPTETQKDFSVALKAFHENSSLCFIIVGVWLEENRLAVYNGDLSGRITAINADIWTESELREVVIAGEQLLNISFDPTFFDGIVRACQGSVHILQEACYAACEQAGIHSTQEPNRTVGTGIDVNALVKGVVDQQRGRYNSFLIQFADGFQDTNLQMYRWLLYPVITTSPKELEDGLRYSQIRKILSTHHPQGKGLNAGNITQALQYSAALQVKKDIKPIVLDYDQTNLRLNVVDRGFLIWLQHQSQKDLLELIGLIEGEASS
jgi:hypothetical protein